MRHELPCHFLSCLLWVQYILFEDVPVYPFLLNYSHCYIVQFDLFMRCLPLAYFPHLYYVHVPFFY